MSAQQNKSLVRREQEELWNHTGELKAAEELFTADQPEAAKKEEAAHFCRGFPDVISTIEDLIAEQEKVVARWRSRATHQGGAIQGHLLLAHRGMQDLPVVDSGGPAWSDGSDRRHSRAGTI